MPTELAVVPPEKLNRQKYIGSSDAAAILGISPWKTALDVYLDKIQPPRPDDPSKAKIFRRGTRMEPYVIDMLAEETGLEIVRRNQRYIDKTHSFIAAEIDAEAKTGENIEIKTVSPFKAKEWGEQQTDEVPLHYLAQGMHAMGVTGAPVCLFGVLIGGDDFRIYRLERDDETIEAIRQKEVEFWDRIQRQDPPEPTTVSDIVRLFGTKDAGSAIEVDDATLGALLRLQTVEKQLKDYEVEKEKLQDAIKLHMQDAAILTYNNRIVATWKEQSSRRFNESAFKEAHPDLHELFKRKIDSRVFRLKKWEPMTIEHQNLDKIAIPATSYREMLNKALIEDASLPKLALASLHQVKGLDQRIVLRITYTAEVDPTLVLQEAENIGMLPPALAQKWREKEWAT